MANGIPTTSGEFQYRGHRLSYEVHGDQGTPLLLLHGLLLDTLLYRDLADRFVAEGYRVVLLDLLGHGQSDKPTDPREHRIDFCAEQALACLDHLGIERALVGGVSLGAVTALQAAAMAPERMLGLFLEMPVMEWSTTFAAMMFVPTIAAVDIARPIVSVWSGFLRSLPRPRTHWMASVMNLIATPPEVITAVLHGVLVGPVVPPRRVRRQLAMPTLVIGHASDRLHSLRDAEALAAELPDAQLIKARSMVELRRSPERMWPEIASFLRRVQQSAEPRRGAASAAN